MANSPFTSSRFLGNNFCRCFKPLSKKKLENIGWNRYQSVYLTVLSLIAIIFILVLLIFPPFIDQFQLLINALPKVPIKINELIENMAGDNYQIFETF